MKFSLVVGALAVLTKTEAAVWPGFEQVLQLFPSLGRTQDQYDNAIDNELEQDYVEDSYGIVEAPSTEGWPWKPLPLISSEALQAYINQPAIEARVDELFGLAEKSLKKFDHPTRVIGSKGHYSTLGYIQKSLYKLAGYYDISLQPFKTLLSNINSYNLTFDGVAATSVGSFELTPPTKGTKVVTGPLVLVSEQGCTAEDFPAAVKGAIALIERGACTFGTKSDLAGQAGALAAVIYNNEPGELSGTLSGVLPHQVATLSLNQEEGLHYVQLLKSGANITTSAFVDALVKNVYTYNVLAQSKLGDPENVVMLGAHSDSVTAGPGINDDGSGTISLLEVATYLTNFNLTNAVRFAWWAAEEEGLVGSDYYVSSLLPEDNFKIRLFMDYDMMASPNYAYQVYDANNDDNPAGSEELKQLYVDFYESEGVNHTFIPFDGRSDYDGFIKNGIPGGGIATGAEGLKTEEEVEQFGGIAGEQYDQCYHQLCDNTTNLAYEAFVLNTKLIAHSVATYALSLEDFPVRAPLNETAVTLSQAPKFKYHGSKLVL